MRRGISDLVMRRRLMEEIVRKWRAALDRLIVETEGRRAEQMLHVIALLAMDEHTTEAERGLRQIERMLVRMRAHQAAEPSRWSKVSVAS